MEKLAASCGLRVATTVFDSGPLQFWGSDRYAAGETLGEPPTDLGDLPSRADALNDAERGDQAAFFLSTVDREVSDLDAVRAAHIAHRGSSAASERRDGASG
jgi:hypothetical protein